MNRLKLSLPSLSVIFRRYVQAFFLFVPNLHAHNSRQFIYCGLVSTTIPSPIVITLGTLKIEVLKYWNAGNYIKGPVNIYRGVGTGAFQIFYWKTQKKLLSYINHLILIILFYGSSELYDIIRIRWHVYVMLISDTYTLVFCFF